MYLFRKNGEDLEIEKNKNGSIVQQNRNVFSCQITSKIMSITARVTNSDFISGIKFNGENGETLCRFWTPESNYWNPSSWNHIEYNIAHNGYFLSHLSGFEDNNFNGIVNGINFFWKTLVPAHSCPGDRKKSLLLGLNGGVEKALQVTGTVRRRPCSACPNSCPYCLGRCVNHNTPQAQCLFSTCSSTPYVG